MARPLRINCSEIPYHIIVRGNNRESIFLDENCYLRYLDLLSGYKERYSFRLYCYCLMANHIHLLVEPSRRTTISKIMHALNTSYTMYFNRKYNHVGHVTQGRFRSILVEKESYLIELTRYIHLNPVRAKIAEKPEDYPWSSYRMYLGKNAGRLIDRELILDLMDSDKEKQVALYQQFVKEGCEEDRIKINDSIKYQLFLGSDEFIEKVLNKCRIVNITKV